MSSADWKYLVEKYFEAGREIGELKRKLSHMKYRLDMIDGHAHDLRASINGEDDEEIDYHLKEIKKHTEEDRELFAVCQER